MKNGLAPPNYRRKSRSDSGGEYRGLASVTMLAKPGLSTFQSRLKLYWSVPSSMLWPLKKPTPLSLSPPSSSIA